LGHNSIWLAQNGWDVDAVDVSDRGLLLADEVARANRVHVQWIAADVDFWRAEVQAYDVALVFRFLERESTPRIIYEALRPGGWVIYETFSRAQFDRPDNHLRNLDYTLAPGELAESMFSDFEVVLHRVEELKDRSVERFLGRRSS
jgi:2-polyprenyl-3-methyl-5-hydroxy-6-metoxy-1,4-benzoquinol methylase